MTGEATPWGEASFERDRNWYAHLQWKHWDTKQQYSELRQRALEDPTFDLFEHFMPTGKPKHDIGRYVMRHNVRVPLISSMEDWQSAMVEGVAMLRSELPQDYDGYSGLLSSLEVGTEVRYPIGPDGYEDRPWDGQRRVEGPVYQRPTVHYGWRGESRKLSSEKAKQHDLFMVEGLLDGSIDPAYVLEVTDWSADMAILAESAASWRYAMPLGWQSLHLDASASRWRYVPGKNLKVMRDPVVEGKYYVGVTNTHHDIWLLQEGRDSPDMAAYHNKADHFPAYHGGFNEAARLQPEYTLPTKAIIDTYEKVRTLPYFDHSQVPLMELQYGQDGQVYFLQYLKTGRTLNDPGAFPLPSGENVVTIHDVSGATEATGEKVRVYLDPPVFTRSMENQAFFMRDCLASGMHVQAAAMMAKVCIQDYWLSFKDNHLSSAPLVRPQVAIGLLDEVGEGSEKFAEVAGSRFNFRRIDDVKYIDAIVTSNGRAATIESNWDVKIERPN